MFRPKRGTKKPTNYLNALVCPRNQLFKRSDRDLNPVHNVCWKSRTRNMWRPDLARLVALKATLYALPNGIRMYKRPSIYLKVLLTYSKPSRDTVLVGLEHGICVSKVIQLPTRRSLYSDPQIIFVSVCKEGTMSWTASSPIHSTLATTDSGVTFTLLPKRDRFFLVYFLCLYMTNSHDDLAALCNILLAYIMVLVLF